MHLLDVLFQLVFPRITSLQATTTPIASYKAEIFYRLFIFIINIYFYF